MASNGKNVTKSTSGTALIATPTLNKGTAFSYDERTNLQLHGLLPPRIETLEEQVVRAYEAYLRNFEIESGRGAL